MKIITGMHRSGTSLVAKIFFHAGFDMGNSDTFYEADQWNSEGYYEQPDIHRINMPLINGPWWKFSYFRLPSTRVIQKRAHSMETLIRDTAKEYDDKVLKETRFCLTLPAWISYGANVEKIIVCMREPLSVALSIKKRNKTTLSHGYQLWRVHNERILEHIQTYDIPTWYIHYQGILDSNRYTREVGKAIEFFDKSLPVEELQAIRRETVYENMNHNEVVNPDYPPQIQQLWDELLKRHDQQF